MGSRSTSDEALQRQYAVAATLFVILIVGIIFVFGHLISSSLSRTYLEDSIITGREEARRLAEELVNEQFHVTEKRRELMGRTIQGLPQREVLESIEVTDLDGAVVFNLDLRSTEELDDQQFMSLELNGALSDQDVVEREDTYEISVPLGDVGRVVGRVSKARLAERVVGLRRELLLQTATVAGLTLAALLTSFAIVWFLIQRTRRAETHRRQAEQLAALGTLAANLAHEIRNPLNSINLNLELLDEDLDGDVTQAKESLQSTRQEVSRLAQLVSDFLTYARPSPPNFEALQVLAMLKEVVTFLRPEAQQKGVHLKLTPGTEDDQFKGDQAQLRQVLLNLVLNAVQAVAPLKAERRVVELGARAKPGEVALVVRDRGNGIPKDDIAQVRQAFNTRRRGGTGLGLAIADRIVAAHGGRIELNNLPNSGFEAVVALPASGDDGKIGP